MRVQGYNEDVGERSNCRIVSAVVAYDHLASGDVYMLVIHQAILIPDMPNNLLCPMQLRDHGLAVNDEPKHMALNPTEEHHAITFRACNTRDGGLLRIPLELHGVTSYFPSRKPTKEEYENTPDDLRVELTAEAPDWDPASTTFQQQEEAMLQADGGLKDSIESWSLRRTISALNTIAHSETPDFHLGDAMHSHKLVNPDTPDPQTIGSITSGVRKPCIQATKLAKNWGIGLEPVTRTIEATTQRGLQTVLHNTLSQRFRTNDRQLRYRRLMHEVFTDTLESPVLSWFRQNRYAQVFATRFGWSRVFPMRHKADAHEGLSLLAQRDGSPPTNHHGWFQRADNGALPKKCQGNGRPRQANRAAFSLAECGRARHPRVEEGCWTQGRQGQEP